MNFSGNHPRMFIIPQPERAELTASLQNLVVGPKYTERNELNGVALEMKPILIQAISHWRPAAFEPSIPADLDEISVKDK